MESCDKESELTIDREGGFESRDECSRDSHDQNPEDGNDSRRIGFPYQIRLCLLFFAVQLSVGFYGIYGLLSLQYFGLPTYLISSPSLISGLLSLTLVPAIGAFSDRGPRPKFRKTVIQGLGLCILLVAYILIASSAAITSKDVIGKPKEDNLSRQLNVSCDRNSSFHPGRNCNAGVIDIANSTLVGLNSSSSPSIENTDTTIAGVLGIIAISSIAVSYDMTTSIAKGLIVECVPPCQKTQILNTSSMMCGIGSCIMSCVGMSDLPHHLGKHFNTDGMALTLILMCSCFSAISILLFGTSMRSALLLDHKGIAAKCNDSNKKELVLLTNETEAGNGVTQGTQDNDISYTKQQNGGNLLENSDADKNSTNKQHLDIIAPQKDCKHNMCKRLCSVYPQNRRFNLTVFSAFLGIGSSITGVLFFSHTLTIEVYKGDPTATPGTLARDLYEQGIKMASVGFLISSAVFIPTSIANKKLLKLADHHLLLALGSAMLSVSTLLYFLLQNVATFFVVMGAYGFYGSMGNVIPYSNALKYAYPANKLNLGKGNSSDETKATAGRITTLVSSMIPLNLLLLTFMGPAMESFGNGWLPMLYIIGLSAVNVVVNAIIKVL